MLDTQNVRQAQAQNIHQKKKKNALRYEAEDTIKT